MLVLILFSAVTYTRCAVEDRSCSVHLGPAGEVFWRECLRCVRPWQRVFFVLLISSSLLLSLVWQGRNPVMAKTLLEEMQGLGLTPTRFCWNSVISVHARTGNTTGMTRKLHRAQKAALHERFEQL